MVLVAVRPLREEGKHPMLAGTQTNEATRGNRVGGQAIIRSRSRAC